MASKKEILLDSISKLLEMSISQDEIIENLAEVGVSRPEALLLIKEAKNPKKPNAEADLPKRVERKIKKMEPSSARFDKVFQKLDEEKAKEEKKSEPKKRKKQSLEEKRQKASEELAQDLVDTAGETRGEAEDMLKDLSPSQGPEEEQDEEESGEEVPEQAPGVEQVEEPEEEQDEISEEEPGVEQGEIQEEEPEEEKPKHFFRRQVPERVEERDLSKLWEKGILATVNSRLREMKELKEGIDAVMDEKVEAASKRELEKIKVLLDSQRSLLISKVDAEIESKANSFAEMIEAKIHEMKGLASDIASSVEKLEAEKAIAEDGEATLAQRIKELGSTKSKLVAGMNSELIKAKSEIEQFLAGAKAKLDAMDERINKTLELESDIVEGLAKDAEAKIEEKIHKNEFLSGQETSDKISSLRERLESLEAKIKKGLPAGASLKEFKSGMDLMEREMRARLDSLDRLQAAFKREFKPGDIEEKVNRLDLFRKRISDSIEGNVENFNDAVRRFNETAAESEKQINLRLEKIDRKIEELDAFEKNFAKEMGIAITKLKKKRKK